MELIGLALLVLYAGGSWKFWKGFKKTNFTEGRVRLTLLWPFLLTNKSYRKNFTKALKG